MLGLQGNASTPRVYRCVACSDTFSGLASLLVHQASHASMLSKVSASPPTQPNTSSQEMLFTTPEPAGPPAMLPESPSPSFYICDCGEEFLNFDLLLEHKQSHVPQLLQPFINNDSLAGGEQCNDVFLSQQASFTVPRQAGLDLSCPSTSMSTSLEASTSNSHAADVALEDHVAMVTSPLGQCSPPQDVSLKQTENMATISENVLESDEDIRLGDQSNSFHSVKGENLPKNDILMRLLASAYKNHYPPPLSENQNDNKVVPKQEAIPVEIISVAKPKASSVNEHSIAQLRRLLIKPGIKTKAPSISKILESSKKRVVSLTKTLSPVVVLETRQKLVDPTCKGTFGRYQCGRCRKVFLNLDKLTEHHFLHKKERIKCCRRCKQLIIGRLPLPDNHVCPQIGSKSVQPGGSLKNKSPFPPKMVPFHSLNNVKKVYHCPMCKRSYARRWNLKMHRCPGQMSLLSRQMSPSMQMFTMRANSANTNVGHEEEDCHKSIAVGTEAAGHIKVESASPKCEQSAPLQLPWTPAALNFSPFPMTEPHQNPALASLQEGEVESWEADELDNEDGKGQWAIPLDDESHMFRSANKGVEDEPVKQSGSAEHLEAVPHSLRFFVADGVKRYPCNRCQKTYSRASTLRRHLRLCGFRPRGFGAVAPIQSQSAITLNSGFVKPMFSCFICGKSFNRKDNMMAHRKRCQFQRTMSGVERVTVQQSLTGDAATDCQTQRDDSGNWGIMSLPSVLPRRVTCECGVGFTSPRLLMEHLQKHAQESYTCPTCGETVNSWAQYEVHLQIHMHPHHQLMKGLQPKRSQPILVRLQQPQQQQPQQQQQSQQQQQPQQQQLQQQQQQLQQLTQSVLQPPLNPPQEPPHPELISRPAKKQRIVCTRCGNTFASRCSLRRHISWNRCKGVRVTNPPKTFHCSHCNADFPNTLSLMFHQRSGACKPAIKPVRCPVCLRWFGTMDTLEKHLLTHKQSESYQCDVCQGTYPSLKSLKNHRRRIHRILIGNTA
uniref:C2H2-type domain-containing protein n=1 Tax=Iconisemion striatum TaxID=60296 RepID=A0A1A7XRP5_9TELE